MRKVLTYTAVLLAALAASAVAVLISPLFYGAYLAAQVPSGMKYPAVLEGGVTEVPRSPVAQNVSVNRLRKSDQAKVFIRYDDKNDEPQVAGPMYRRVAEAELKDFSLGKNASVCSWCKPTPFSKVYGADSSTSILDPDF